MQVYLHSHKEPRHSQFDLRLEEKNARQPHLSLLFRLYNKHHSRKTWAADFSGQFQIFSQIRFPCPHTDNGQLQYYCVVIHFSKITNISENIKRSNGLETYPLWVGRHDADIWLLQHIVSKVGRHNEKVSACSLYLVWKQFLTFALFQRVGGRHHEALQPPFPTGIWQT